MPQETSFAKRVGNQFRNMPVGDGQFKGVETVFNQVLSLSPQQYRGNRAFVAQISSHYLDTRHG